MYKNILVAFDGSEGSMEALQHAIGYVRENGGNLTVAHVIKSSRDTRYPPQQNMGVIGGNAFMPVANDARPISQEIDENPLRTQPPNPLEEAERTLSEAKTELAKANIKAETEVLEGDAAKSLCQYAEEHNIDLIVIGSRGLSGIKRLVLGSVSQKVAEHAECTVLVVK